MDFLSLITANGLITWWGILIVAAGCFLAGYVDAIAGGGGLIQLPAFIVAGLPIHLAIGTNKLASPMGTILAAVKYARQGYMALWLCAPCIVVALIGSNFGAHLSLLASEDMLRIIMLAVIPVAGFYVLHHKDMGTEDAPWPRHKTLGICLVISLFIGIYDGIYGPGTGTFLMLLLTSFGGLGIQRAAGVTKCVNATTNLTALVVFLLNGTVVISVGIIGGLFNIAGSYFGANQFTEKGTQIARPIMLVVLTLFAIRLVMELIAG